MPIKKMKEWIVLLQKGDESIKERRDLISLYKEFMENKIKITLESLELTTKKIMEYDKAVIDILNNDMFYKKGGFRHDL